MDSAKVVGLEALHYSCSISDLVVVYQVWIYAMHHLESLIRCVYMYMCACMYMYAFQHVQVVDRYVVWTKPSCYDGFGGYALGGSKL